MFVFEDVISQSLNASAPTTVNVLRSFTHFLVKKGFEQFRAEEVAEQQQALIWRKLNEASDEWRALGLPSPIGPPVDWGDNWLTWRHPRFFELTGQTPLQKKYIIIHDWISALDPREYLLVGVLFLKILGCNPIYITDGANDEGVDCIGRIENGPLRSIVVLVQAKTRQGNRTVMGKDIVLQEYGKFSILGKTRKYREYLEALRFREIIDGSASLYFVISNVEFDRKSREIAKELGIVLRSRRQMAHLLGGSVSLRSLYIAQKEVVIPRGPDLSWNVSGSLDKYIRV